MIPVSGLAKLSKGVLEIAGPDAAKFLNGLVTTRFLPNIVKKNQYTISDVEFKHVNLGKLINLHENWGIMHEDIYDPDNEILIRRDGVSSMFLNSKGRVISDSFLYPKSFHHLNDNVPSYLVEVDSKIMGKLGMMIQMHKLMSDIQIKKAPYHSYYYYNDSVEFDEFLDHIQVKYLNTYTPKDAIASATKFINHGVVVNKDASDNLLGFAIDNRIPNFGLKFLTKEPISSDFFSDEFKSSFKVSEVDEDTIAKRRFLNGLYESGDSPSNFSLLPFDMNLDYINGLSLDKGCYVGQELTIRTYNGGVIRKRIVPVQFFEINESNFEKCDNDELQLNENDEVIEHLSKMNVSNLDKLEITPLDDEPQPVNQLSPSPFGESPFGGAAKPRRSKVGKLLSVKDNLGFVLINLTDAHKKYFKVEIPDLSPKFVGIKIIKPNWWPEED
ncbi:ccr4 associated factor [Yamadazyma tenuis]|uniref:Aminomethyltransferase folate-binding domain-containing protein n=1 Tax=Candida tenuis (strain ATCC 10573 / BCRC 21748 / CBS 615 / JCM 9827 / NBRC 10315 / NRRL Y-1498 / VKM Y-70) TaxID=590646 RepID=G3B2T2_CANTC|nr:Aminomethyltransferase folate-binding domain-containing protein [Yamadazyma tenuis ATCC 10573]XP_006685928.1 uncharacterized protein CANTEDRAFT_113532 [Yamadazyma tenuis ATCC 10573]EGV65121.1 Aminomethyltransferase folate-binding domain-containing protein [Yamadazyma tenuis ATCC 10573]EGV65122.1 hypothetical protein CANTEDRAFT_113532 [Yamadazyma tenuis ATCC 10573]WEJ97545.1 ccr4 associated factor [Yamadazyma tenuis]